MSQRFSPSSHQGTEELDAGGHTEDAAMKIRTVVLRPSTPKVRVMHVFLWCLCVMVVKIRCLG